MSLAYHRQVCTEQGKLAEGVQGQKRLILEHAATIYDDLRSTEAKTMVLEAGYAIDQGGEVVLCKVKRHSKLCEGVDVIHNNGRQTI